jgi:hypothetical protein
MEKLVIIGSGSGVLPIASTVAKFRKNHYDIMVITKELNIGTLVLTKEEAEKNKYRVKTFVIMEHRSYPEDMKLKNGLMPFRYVV